MAAHDYSQPDATEGEPVFWHDSASENWIFRGIGSGRG
jgi:hypothetical protein